MVGLSLKLCLGLFAADMLFSWIFFRELCIILLYFFANSSNIFADLLSLVIYLSSRTCSNIFSFLGLKKVIWPFPWCFLCGSLIFIKWRCLNNLLARRLRVTMQSTAFDNLKRYLCFYYVISFFLFRTASCFFLGSWFCKIFKHRAALW